MEGNPDHRDSSDDEPFTALAFKIMTDPFVGRLIISGFIPERLIPALTR